MANTVSEKLLLTYIVALNLLFICQSTFAQELVKPFSARAYWLEEQDPIYKDIQFKIDQGFIISEDEKEYLDFYQNRLREYFEKLSNEEKERYRIFKPQWDEEVIILKGAEESDFLEENISGINPGNKYRLYNGLYGFVYGSMLVAITEPDDAGISIGLPFLLAGGSLLLPVINPSKYDDMSYNSVMLNRHGKFFGLIDGAALGVVLFGGRSENSFKGILATSTAGSIAMGEIGFQLGKNVDWTEGRIAGYTHYAAITPLIASGLYGSFVNTNEDLNERVFAGLLLVSGAASYFISNRLWEKYYYTRGDMIATSSFSILSAALGFSFIGQIESGDDQKKILIPTISLLAGSLASHTILRSKNLTSRNGWRVNYVAGAGALVGLGTVLALQPEGSGSYFLLPAIGGFIGWSAMLSSVSSRSQLDKSVRGSFSYDFNPENYIYNQSQGRTYFSPDRPGAPVFSLRLTF